MDIKSTAIPRAYVGEVLRPYASEHLAAFVAAHHDEPDIQAILSEARRQVPGQDPADTLTHWMAVDAPAAPLRALQGLIWREGFESGALAGPIYPDVGPSLRRWARAGIRLAIYSAASRETQRQLFAHAPEGDLTGLFQGFFDTRVGLKAEPDSFSRLAIALAVPTMEVLYVAADEDELDSAAAAGMRTCQVLRPDAGGAAAERHPVARGFDDVAARMGLPAAHDHR
jgi:enolase-phosphatase E1